MKKRLCKFLIFAVCMALAVCGLVACGKKQPDGTGSVGPGSGGGDGGTPDIYPVMERSISVVENASAFRIAWDGAIGAEGYTVIVNGDTVSLTGTRLSLRDNPDIHLPSDKVFNFTIIATAPGKKDSEPTTKAYTAEGNIKLNSPKIKSFDNGTLEWECTGASNFVLKINGSAVKTAGSNYYSATSVDLSGYVGALNVELYAAGDGMYTLDSDKVSFGVNTAHTKLTMAQPSLTVSNGVLSWNAVGGAKGYRVVDINRAVKYVYADEADEGMFKYDLNDRVLVYGVYPDSSDPSIEDTPVEMMNINYLEGAGTTTSPYLIKTAFDLRAIDYYETLYAEKIKTAPATPRNNYRIENDINYLSAVDDGTNIIKLATAFYGTLDGNNKKLSGIKVDHQAGRWSLFDEIVVGATVKNITFVSPVIKNSVIDPKLPINASIATVAYNNGGTIDGIKITGANYQAAGGEISGICSHNYGVVRNCQVSGAFKQNTVGLTGEAAYEMAGIVLENKSGGQVTGNSVGTLTMTGSTAKGDSGTYSNIRTVGGIVSVNRRGGTVSNNSYTTITVTNALTDFEAGGLVAYNAQGGTVTKGTGTIGNFTFNGTPGAATAGNKVVSQSKTVGKNDGTFTN